MWYKILNRGGFFNADKFNIRLFCRDCRSTLNSNDEIWTDDVNYIPPGYEENSDDGWSTNNSCGLFLD